MNKKETEEHILFPSESNVTTEKRGEIPCLIVHSDETHVDYIHNILNPIKVLLPELGYDPKFLSEEIESLKQYGCTIEQLASKCPLGIVILDGLRPNVLFELGILFGKNKPIIVIQDEKAKVAIKSYYDKNFTNSNITETQFNRLCNPPLGYFKHISDLGGLHIIKINSKAAIDDKNHPKIVLKAEIEKIKSDVTDEYNRILLESEPLIKGEHFENFQSVVIEISDFIIKSKEFNKKDLDDKISKLNSIEINTRINLPHQIYSNIAALYKKLGNSTYMQDTAHAKSCYLNSVVLYKKIMNIVDDKLIHAKSYFNLGIIYNKLSDYDDKIQYAKKAIASFKMSLEVYTLKHFPNDYINTQNNIGNSYGSLAEIENMVLNSEKAIDAFNKALKICKIKEQPHTYALLKSNMGTAFGTLAIVENKLQNSLEAVRNFEDALKIYTIKEFPLEYARLQSNLGNTYRILSEVEEKKTNCIKSINSCKEALKIRTLEKYPLEHSLTIMNLGVAYGSLALVENSLQNIKKSIKSFNAALKFLSYDQFPYYHCRIHSNLGNAYNILAEVESKKENCLQGIFHFEQSLREFTINNFPYDYATVQGNLGNTYFLIAEIESKKENCRKAINSYKNALKFFTKKTYLQKYEIINNNLIVCLKFCNSKEI